MVGSMWSAGRLMGKILTIYHSPLTIDRFNIAGSSNGRTSPFGGEYLGSSPSPAAINF